MPIAEGWSPHSHHTEGVKIEKEKDVVSEGCTESRFFCRLLISKNWSEVGYLYCAWIMLFAKLIIRNILYEPEKIFFWGMTRVRQHLHIRNKETLVMQEIYLRKML